MFCVELAFFNGLLGWLHRYNLPYESRNEPHLARPGGIAYPLVPWRQYEDLSAQAKRWTYQDRLTRKARKLHALKARLTRYSMPHHLGPDLDQLLP